MTTNDVFINRVCAANKSEDVGGLPTETNNKKYAHSGTEVTHAEFIDRVHKASPDIVILGTYTKAKEKIRCKCARCGDEWDVLPEVLYRGKQCKKCGPWYQRHRDGFLAKLEKIHPTLDLIGEYVNSTTRVRCKCRICDFEFEITPNGLWKGNGCARCAGTLPWTKDEIVAELACIYPSVEMVGEYKNTQVPVECHCKVCDTYWKVRPSQLMQKRGCPECGKKKIGNALRKTQDEFVEEMTIIMPTIRIVGEYKDWKTPLLCHCNVCDDDFYGIPNNLRKQEGCPRCGRAKSACAQRKPHEQFVNEVTIANPKIEVVSHYLGVNQKLECKCLICNKSWLASPSSLLHGHGCPDCSHSQTSFAEQTMLLALRKVLGENQVLSRDIGAIGKEIDIYIPSIKAGVEVGSWLWHASKVSADMQKVDLCNQQGIKLITVYDSFSGNKDAFGMNFDNLLTYESNLGLDSKRNELIDCVKNVFNKLLIEYTLSEEDESELFRQARMSSTRINNRAKEVVNLDTGEIF